MSPADAADALLGTAEDMVRKALAAGADEAEVFAAAGREVSAEIEAGSLSCTSVTGTTGFGVRVVRDGRVGHAWCARPGDAGTAIAEASALARHAPRTGYTLPDAGRATHEAWDNAIATLAPDDAIDAVQALLQGWQETAPHASFPGGGATLTRSTTAIASSRGAACTARTTEMHVAASLVFEEGGPVSTWESDVSTRRDLDPHATASRAAQKGLDLVRPAPAPVQGACDIVLSPQAAAELVVGFVTGAAEGDAAHRGNSVWRDALGGEVAHAGLSILDDALRPHAVGATSFDDEGLAARSLPVIEAGVLRSFLYDSWDAHRHGQASTASGVRAGPSGIPGTGTHHVVVEHREARDLEALLAGMGRGYLVDSLLGAHTANATTGEYSVTAPNVWRVDGGAVEGACREIALAGTVPDLLQACVGASKEVRPMEGLTLPHLWFQDVHVSHG